MFKKVVLISAAAFFAYTVGPAYADHVGGHKSVARGGIKALDERIWNLEQENADQNQAISDLEQSLEDLKHETQRDDPDVWDAVGDVVQGAAGLLTDAARRRREGVRV